MKKLAVVIGTALALALPTVAAPVAHAQTGCSAGKYSSNRGFYSYCSTSSGVKAHYANAQIYFNSGYSQWKNSPSTPAGFTSYSGVYNNAYVMAGPFVITIS
ncbi:MAG: hypothetical protein Q4G35_02410 [Propionibacteriaceae bacterium]|nr:hypothetical protein [Propionibacteriaceae bacterium]